ncbi:MAG: glycosyltransferase family 9 protein [Bacteroidetes bacterium]|nr:MAG: glycosyltransferase family 9 protein [Bacteroidota bacterium]
MAQRILIIRFSSIGDIILTTPVIRAIREQYPDAHIGFATKKQFGSLLQANPYVNSIHGLDQDFKSFQTEIKEAGYTYYIDLHHNLRSKRLTSSLQIPGKAFNKLNLEKWLLVNLKWNRLPDTHIVNRYMETGADLNLQYDGKGLDYFFPTEHAKPDLPFEQYISIAIGGQHATKKLPTLKLKELIEGIQAPVVLLGGPEDVPVSDELLNSISKPDLLSYCGKASLADSAYIAQQSLGLITHDTGMMHIGAALDVPIISVWGNTVPEFGMYPFYPSHSAQKGKSAFFEVKNLKCRPCSKIGYAECPKGHFKCMQDQDIKAMLAQIQTWL